MENIDTSKLAEDNHKEQWKKSVEDYRGWVSAGERNLYTAEVFFKNYHDAWNSLEKKMSEFAGQNTTEKEWKDSNTQREIIMFYGFALECFLKAYYIKYKFIEPIVAKDFSLNQKLLTHDVEKMFTRVLNIPTEKEVLKLKKIQRAIKSGKYPFERRPDSFAYTGELNETVSFSKETIEKIKLKLK